MATRIDILAPVGQPSGTFNAATMLSSIASGLVYDVTGYARIVSQIDTPLDSALAGTVTLQCSLNGQTWYNIPSGAVSYTSSGVNQAVGVEGLRFVRFQFTATSGVVEIDLTVVGIADE